MFEFNTSTVYNIKPTRDKHLFTRVLISKHDVTYINNTCTSMEQPLEQKKKNSCTYKLLLTNECVYPHEQK